ncbi:MAG: 2-iminoacetate synthase ThiH, partial [Syntrophales bacterium]|nr:2-iminoacetate synthase ThiH [Syntrophales bacterium]
MRLRLDDEDKEGAAIASSGLRHILILTGESQSRSPVDYIRNCVGILKRYFHDISIEIYPLAESDYSSLVQEGVDGLTIYQETYDEVVYRRMHPAGPKRDYRFRLEAPERGGRSRMRHISVGALLGLADWRRDAFFTALHARYLMERYPDADIGASVPRLRPFAGSFVGSCEVTDQDLTQVILALRLFLPRLGISLSTREAPTLRENLLPLGITQMSAGSVTSVGGHREDACDDSSQAQFDIADHRSISDTIDMIKSKGYDPILSNWIPHAVAIMQG